MTTQKSKSDLLAQLPDNLAKEITPVRIRDIVESANFSFGSLYFSTSAETTIGSSGVYVKAAGTTTVVNTNRATHSTNRLTYTGAPDVHAHIASSISMTSAGNNVTHGIAIAKNGTVLEHSKLTRKVSTGADVGSTAVHADAILSTNDYLELWVSDEGGTTNMTVEYGYIFFMGMLV